MDVLDERVFLEEVADRLNAFVRDFPIEADRVFGDPRAFGHEVEEMFCAIAGENIEVPFGVLLTSILTRTPGTSAGYFLQMVWDETDMLVGFEVVEVEETTAEEILKSTLKKTN